MEYSNKTTLLLIEEENKLIILKFLYDVNAGYKKGSMYEFVRHDKRNDVFKVGNEYKYVEEEFRGDSYMLINNPTAIERLQFGIMQIAEYLGWDITKTYEDIKNKSKDELLCDFIKIKDLVLSDVENKVIDLLLR